MSAPAEPPYMLVLGYGNGWTPYYVTYLDAVAGAFHRTHAEWIVLSGGVTGKPKRDISEAEWMAHELIQRGIPRERMRFEEDSQNTFQNFTCSLHLGLLAPEREAVICCDTYRLSKVQALATTCGLNVTWWLHVPIVNPRMGLIIRTKSWLDAARINRFGIPASDRRT